MNLEDLKGYIQENGIILSNPVISIEPNDTDISGGRRIVNVKSNQLFTGRFEERDVIDFVRVWNHYKNDKLNYLRNSLLKNSKVMILNYHGEVCPIEVLLYTSNIISSEFSNYKLAEEVANVVVVLWKENNSYLSSIEHIVNTWRWEHVINICAIAVGKICALSSANEKAVDLMHYIFDLYKDDDATRQGCFMGVLETKCEEFVSDIYNVIHDLTGTDSDKKIGNLFKRKFPINFPGCCGQLNAEMFWSSPSYAKNLVAKFLNDDNGNTLVGQYQKNVTKKGKEELIEIALDRIRSGNGRNIYDAVNMLRMAADNRVSESMYCMMRLDNYQGEQVTTLPIISYFGNVHYAKANIAMKNVDYDNDYYSACRMSLFRQGSITSESLMEGYLSETRPRQIKNYLSGFAGLNDKVPDVKEGVFKYFSRELDNAELKIALMNYEKLICKYKHLYNPLVGEMFKELFGYKTVFGTVKIRITEQNTCLNIIEKIIDSANYKKYEDFLYYVAEQGINFNPTITNHAKNILRNINSDRIKM